MKIYKWNKESLKCYEGKNSVVVFTPKCKSNCGYCENPSPENSEGRIDKKEFFDYLKLNRKNIEGVVIAGGEPTTQHGLKDFVKNLKEFDLLVKLYTNGVNYSLLQEMRNEKLVDYVSMEVKGPIKLYPLIDGNKSINVLDNIAKGIFVVSQFPDYDFRTTVSLVYQDGKPRWITDKEIGETAELIENWIFNGNGVKYFLESFKAIDRKSSNKKIMKSNLPKEFHETPLEHLEECLIEAKKHLPYTKIKENNNS